MTETPAESKLQHSLEELLQHDLSPLDFLPDGSLAEKMIDLVINGSPLTASSILNDTFKHLTNHFKSIDREKVRVVVFGGGSGLSNILGGDSRRERWISYPFTGLKELFPHTNSVVCVTDDGGSTGELLKELPIVALGDIRHVLLSSIRKESLQNLYGLDEQKVHQLATQLHTIFNYRFTSPPSTAKELLDQTGALCNCLPSSLLDYLGKLLETLFTRKLLHNTLQKPQCLGNLLLAAAIFLKLPPEKNSAESDPETTSFDKATIDGLSELSLFLGGSKHAVQPCTTTMAQLEVLYENGVLVTSEQKSGSARRGFPVDRVFVNFFDTPSLPAEITKIVREADIFIFAPGSLYTSIIPILHVPGIAEEIRNNNKALKLLVSNIWVQKGETDVAPDHPHRKFYVSDMIHAYHSNIPGGVKGLFNCVLTLGLGDVPGSILQSYALEEKEPIYLDRAQVREMGFEVIEAGIFSRDLLALENVIQHDPHAVAQAINTLWGLKKSGHMPNPLSVPEAFPQNKKWLSYRKDESLNILPCKRYLAIKKVLNSLSIDQALNGDPVSRLKPSEHGALLDIIGEIIWSHPDILLEHLLFFKGITLIDPVGWSRCQEWDNVFSFYDPDDLQIKIRKDQLQDRKRFEVAFLVALGQSLLGNYRFDKGIEELHKNEDTVGSVYKITLCEKQNLHSFFNVEEIHRYLHLSRMKQSEKNSRIFTRVINGKEGFTPPGLLCGLFYAWYLDNRFATHIEYKMSIMRNEISNLIPEQVKIVDRRSGLIRFFRETVFRHKII